MGQGSSPWPLVILDRGTRPNPKFAFLYIINYTCTKRGPYRCDILRNPKLKIIQSTNTTELSVRFGRKAKQLMDSPEYKEVFQTRLKEDSQAAGKWETQQGGEYYAAGVGSAITGRGADLLIIDDPHTEQDAMNAQALDRTYEWYTSGPRQRLQPGGTIVIVMTRWNEKDLAGRLIRSQKEPKADQWEVIEFPAILPTGKPLWPEYWNLKDLESVVLLSPFQNGMHSTCRIQPEKKEH
jgi:hypothetical protein